MRGSDRIGVRCPQPREALQSGKAQDNSYTKHFVNIDFVISAFILLTLAALTVSDQGARPGSCSCRS